MVSNKPISNRVRILMLLLNLAGVIFGSAIQVADARGEHQHQQHRNFGPRRDGRRTSIVVTSSDLDKAHHSLNHIVEEPVPDDSDTVIRKIKLMRIAQRDQDSHEASNSGEQFTARPHPPAAVIEPTQHNHHHHHHQQQQQQFAPATATYPAAIQFMGDTTNSPFTHQPPSPQQQSYYHQPQYQQPPSQPVTFMQRNEGFVRLPQFHHQNPYKMVKKQADNFSSVVRSKQRRKKASQNKTFSGFLSLDNDDEHPLGSKEGTWPSTSTSVSAAGHSGGSVSSSSMSTKDYSYAYTVHSPKHKTYYNSASRSTPEGLVKGHYSFVDANGHLHVTEYVAGGKDGYRARVYTVRNYDPSKRRSADGRVAVDPTRGAVVTQVANDDTQESADSEQQTRKQQRQGSAADSATLMVHEQPPSVEGFRKGDQPIVSGLQPVAPRERPQQQLLVPETPSVYEVLQKSAGIASEEVDDIKPDVQPNEVLPNKVPKDSSEEDSEETPLEVAKPNKQQQLATTTRRAPQQPASVVQQELPHLISSIADNPARKVYQPAPTVTRHYFANLNAGRRDNEFVFAGKAPISQYFHPGKKSRGHFRLPDRYLRFTEHRLEPQQKKHQLQHHSHQIRKQPQAFIVANGNPLVHTGGAINVLGDDFLKYPVPVPPPAQRAPIKTGLQSAIASHISANKDSLDLSQRSAENALDCLLRSPGSPGCSTSTSDEAQLTLVTPTAASTSPVVKKPTEELLETTLPTLIPDGVVLVVTHGSTETPENTVFASQTGTSTSNGNISSVSNFAHAGVTTSSKEKQQDDNNSEEHLYSKELRDGLVEDYDILIGGLIDPRPTKTTKMKSRISTNPNASTNKRIGIPTTSQYAFGERIPARDINTDDKFAGRTLSGSVGNPSSSFFSMARNHDALGMNRRSKTLLMLTSGNTKDTHHTKSRDGTVVEVSPAGNALTSPPKNTEVIKEQQVAKMKEIQEELQKKYAFHSSSSAESGIKVRLPSTAVADDEQPPTRNLLRLLVPSTSPSTTTTTTSSADEDVHKLASKLVKKIEAAAEQRLMAKLSPTSTTGWGTEGGDDRTVWKSPAGKENAEAAIANVKPKHTLASLQPYQLPLSTTDADAEDSADSSSDVTPPSNGVTGTTPTVDLISPTEGNGKSDLGSSQITPIIQSSPQLEMQHSSFDVPNSDDEAMLSTLRIFTSLPKLPGSFHKAGPNGLSDGQTPSATTGMRTPGKLSVSSRPNLRIQANSKRKTELLMNELLKYRKQLLNVQTTTTGSVPLPTVALGRPKMMITLQEQPMKGVDHDLAISRKKQRQSTQGIADIASTSTSEPTTSISTSSRQTTDGVSMTDLQQSTRIGVSPQESTQAVAASLASTKQPPTSPVNFPVTGSPVTQTTETTSLQAETPTTQTTAQITENIMSSMPTADSTAKIKGKGKRKKSKKSKKAQNESSGDGVTITTQVKPEVQDPHVATMASPQSGAITDMVSLMNNLMAATLPPQSAPFVTTPSTTTLAKTTSLPTTIAFRQEPGITSPLTAAGGITLMPSDTPSDGTQQVQSTSVASVAAAGDKPAKKKSKKRGRKNKQKGTTHQGQTDAIQTSPSALGTVLTNAPVSATTSTQSLSGSDPAVSNNAQSEKTSPAAGKSSRTMAVTSSSASGAMSPATVPSSRPN